MTRDDYRKACAEAIMSFMEWDDLYGSRRAALGILDDLHGIAWVIPVEATQGERPLRHGNIKNNNLTNPPEGK